MRIIITLAGMIAVALMTACSSPVPLYNSDTLSSMLQPQPSQAKLIVYYPYSYVWSDRIASVKAAGESGCRLKSGHFVIDDLKPGIQTIAISLCNGNEVSSLKINAHAGRKYYIQVVPNDKSVAGRIAASEVISTEGRTHVEGTAFVLDLVSEDVAVRQLPYLKMAK